MGAKCYWLCRTKWIWKLIISPFSYVLSFPTNSYNIIPVDKVIFSFFSFNLTLEGTTEVLIQGGPDPLEVAQVQKQLQKALLTPALWVLSHTANLRTRTTKPVYYR
ncbi:hypothetical protein LZ32DRAFT_612147 [Colletotrichum eremochloae]|nr:hypothetical protein LZ32DRAFT_612147 [Colletotrichum eremochloae]